MEGGDRGDRRGIDKGDGRGEGEEMEGKERK